MSLLIELKRRNVIRVAVAYVVVAWLIIQVAETILPLYDISDSAIRTVVTVLAVLFIPTVVLAWVFEWTPKGIKRDADVARDESLPAGGNRKFDRVVIIVLAVAVAYFAVDEFVIEPTPAPAREHSIAVMPFVNLGSEPEQAYLAGGVAEELRVLIAKIPQLRVISRRSVEKVLATNPDITEIAATLLVAHILEGSVQRVGNRIRITAQLIEAQSDTHVWSETYDRKLDDIFTIQNDIAEKIVDNLHIELLGPMPEARRTDPRALAMFIQAKQVFYQQITQGNWDGIADQMDDFLDSALEIDPGYVDALSWRTFPNWIRGNVGEISPEEYWRRAQQIDAAVSAIDPEHVSVLMNQAWFKAFHEVDFAAATPLWERAYPGVVNDGELLRHIGRFASYIGRFDISAPLYERAVSVDPLCTRCLYHLSRNYMYAGDWDKAEEARERYLLIGGTSGYYFYGIIKLMQGDAERALEIFRDSPMNPETAIAGRVMALHALGRDEESNQALASLLEEFGDKQPKLMAEVHAFRDEKNAAFEWLEKRLSQPAHPINGQIQLIDIVVSPMLHNLHDDPRWEQFRMKLGMPTELIKSLEFSIDVSR